MSDIVIQNATCDCGETETATCNCSLDKFHMTCTKTRIEVHSSIPTEDGVSGTIYYVGNNTDGYKEYVWQWAPATTPYDYGKFAYVEIGDAEGQQIVTATADKAGIVRLSYEGQLLGDSVSSEDKLFHCGKIGLSSQGELYALYATPTQHGVVALSTAQFLQYPISGGLKSEKGYVAFGGKIGATKEGMILAEQATAQNYGTVRLGSAYYVESHTSAFTSTVSTGAVSGGGDVATVAETSVLPSEESFIVGIGERGDVTGNGQLCFGLAIYQVGANGEYLTNSSTGNYEYGALRFRKIPTSCRKLWNGNDEANVNTTSSSRNGEEWELYVKTASDTDLGVVKLATTVSKITDEEIDKIRDTHAISVGGAVDYLKLWTEQWVKENAYGYITNWANSYKSPEGKTLSQNIWDDNKDAICANVETRLVADTVFLNTVVTTVKTEIDSWIKTNITDTEDDTIVDETTGETKGNSYWHQLFGQDIIKLATNYWNDNIDANIQSRVNEKVATDIQSELSTHLGNQENVDKIAAAVQDEVKALVVADTTSFDNIVLEVMSGKRQVELGGVMTTVPEYIESRIAAIFGSRLTALEQRANAYQWRTLCLCSKGKGQAEFSVKNWNSSASGSLYIPWDKTFSHSISLPKGAYTVRISCAPVALIYTSGATGFIVNATVTGSWTTSLSCAWRWIADHGDHNNEKSAAVTTGVSQIRVGDSGIVNINITVNSIPDYNTDVGCSYVLLEFI